MDEVNVADVPNSFDAKLQVPQQITNANDDADGVTSYSSDSHNDETLHSEILELCNQIENVNASSSNRNSNQREEKKMKNAMHSYEVCNQYITSDAMKIEFLSLSLSLVTTRPRTSLRSIKTTLIRNLISSTRRKATLNQKEW